MPVLLPDAEAGPGGESCSRKVAGAKLVLLDPALASRPGRQKLQVPYGVVLHGAEVTVPGRLPGRPPAAALGALGGLARDRGRWLSRALRRPAQPGRVRRQSLSCPPAWTTSDSTRSAPRSKYGGPATTGASH